MDTGVSFSHGVSALQRTFKDSESPSPPSPARHPRTCRNHASIRSRPLQTAFLSHPAIRSHRLQPIPSIPHPHSLIPLALSNLLHPGTSTSRLAVCGTPIPLRLKLPTSKSQGLSPMSSMALLGSCRFEEGHLQGCSAAWLGSFLAYMYHTRASPTHSTRSHGFPSTRCLSRFVSPTCTEHSITFLYCCAMSAACTDIQRSEHARLNLAGLEAGIYISPWGGSEGLFLS